MDTPTIQKKVNDLEAEISRLIYTKNQNFINLNSKYTYYILPIIIFLILGIFKPSFILKQEKISVKKLLFYTLLFSLIVFVMLYFYTYKSNSSS
jgi:hypothetical protein